LPAAAAAGANPKAALRVPLIPLALKNYKLKAQLPSAVASRRKAFLVKKPLSNALVDFELRIRKA